MRMGGSQRRSSTQRSSLRWVPGRVRYVMLGSGQAADTARYRLAGTARAPERGVKRGTSTLRGGGHGAAVLVSAA